ncbi:MAG: presqualene diphosphate synthase HpnD [Dehalococcoidia bacterium]
MTAISQKQPHPALDENAVEVAYDACAAITRAASTNFYYAFLTLPVEKRRAIYAAYAFCRLCDDIVDEPERRKQANEELELVRRQLETSYSGEPSGPIWTAVADTQRRFGIPQHYFADVIDGCEMDITTARYRTFEDLVAYCKRVASAVGLICIEVCGYSDDDAVGYAVDMGIAMQMTNILRDLSEDAENGRVYLPQEDLERFGYTDAELMNGVVNDNFKALMKFEVDRARQYYESGERLFPLLDRRSRACPQAMFSVYRSLLDRIEAADYDVLNQRVSLSGVAKLTLALKLWLRSRIPVLR